MLIENIKSLKQGTPIPKPKASGDFRIKGWGKRRGEPALTYWIPNHKEPHKPFVKGITVTEFNRAYAQIVATGNFTRAWFNLNLNACAKEGSCNFTTIGGIFALLGLARYEGRGTYVVFSGGASNNPPKFDYEAAFDEAYPEFFSSCGGSQGQRNSFDAIYDAFDESRKAAFDGVIEALAKLFGGTKQELPSSDAKEPSKILKRTDPGTAK